MVSAGDICPQCHDDHLNCQDLGESMIELCGECGYERETIDGVAYEVAEPRERVVAGKLRDGERVTLVHPEKYANGERFAGTVFTVRKNGKITLFETEFGATYRFSKQAKWEKSL